MTTLRLTDEERLNLIMRGIIIMPPPSERWQEPVKIARSMGAKRKRRLLDKGDMGAKRKRRILDDGDPYPLPKDPYGDAK